MEGAKYYIVRTKKNVEEYVKKGVSAVGWSHVDFIKYNNVEDLCEKVRNECYHGESSRIIGRKLGEIRRFKGIVKGDYVLVPCTKGFYIGQATGDFKYDEDKIEDDLANQILLDFKKDADGAPMFFARDNKITALSTKLGVRGFTVLPINEEEIIIEINTLWNESIDSSYADRTAKKEAEAFEEFRPTFKIGDYSQIGLKAKGIGFEEVIKELMETDGFHAVVLDKKIGGKGIADADVLAIKKSLLDSDFTFAYYIQAKHYDPNSKTDDGIDQIITFKNELENEEDENGYVQIKGADEVLRLRSDQIRYVLVSSGGFTDKTETKADEHGIILIPGDRFMDMLFRVFDDIPSIRHEMGIIKRYEHIK